MADFYYTLMATQDRIRPHMRSMPDKIILPNNVNAGQRVLPHNGYACHVMSWCRLANKRYCLLCLRSTPAKLPCATKTPATFAHPQIQPTCEQEILSLDFCRGYFYSCEASILNQKSNHFRSPSNSWPGRLKQVSNAFNSCSRRILIAIICLQCLTESLILPESKTTTPAKNLNSASPKRSASADSGTADVSNTFRFPLRFCIAS